jgi:hypothetical protein
MNAIYATFAFPAFLTGLTMILLPALIGRAEAFRFFYGSQTWTMLSNLTIGMQYTVPMIAIFYFISSQHQINISYYMFVYYFTGNVIFGMTIFMSVCNIVDRPIYALINLKGDVKDAENSVDYNIKEYVENFKSIDMMDSVATLTTK